MKLFSRYKLPIISRSSLVVAGLLFAMEAFSNDPQNLIVNGDFSKGKVGELPVGWVLETKHPEMAPRFSKSQRRGETFLLIEGGGQPDIVGGIKTQAKVKFGKTYLFSVRFKVSKEINPHRNLLFQCYGPLNFDGIFEYVRNDDGYIVGTSKITFPGGGDGFADVKILFRFSARGWVRVHNISLTESEPDPPRWVRVGCTSGFTSVDIIPAIVEKSAQEKTDLLLLPEFMNGSESIETLDGPSCKLLSELSQKYRMYIAGGILRKVAERTGFTTQQCSSTGAGNLLRCMTKFILPAPRSTRWVLLPARR